MLRLCLLFLAWGGTSLNCLICLLYLLAPEATQHCREFIALRCTPNGAVIFDLAQVALPYGM